jgi:2-polyprenyl-3-methyl-5-hydroxy-6-metoxy-1,4-benzoquinol methylase
LEIGCSSGYFSQHLVRRGCRVVGVELEETAAGRASSVCQRLIVGDIETAATQAEVSEHFDAVILGDVLEHLRMPDALLECIRRLWLKPGGWVVLSVPNSGHWIFRREVLRGRFPYRQRGLFDRTHLRFFTLNSLSAMVEGAGYRIERKALTVNSNLYEDITFQALSSLYLHSALCHWLIKAESYLALQLPSLFAYQFVLKIRPK